MGSVRCRVDFDTSVGDATYTLLKGSTNFMQVSVLPRIILLLSFVITFNDTTP